MAQTGWFPAKPCKQEDDHAAGLRSLDSTGAAHGSQCRNNQLPRKSVDLISTLHHFDHVAPSSSRPGPKSWSAKSLSQESLAGAASAMENEHGVGAELEVLCDPVALSGSRRGQTRIRVLQPFRKNA